MQVNQGAGTSIRNQYFLLVLKKNWLSHEVLFLVGNKVIDKLKSELGV
jgi:hypothetical protein